MHFVLFSESFRIECPLGFFTSIILISKRSVYKVPLVVLYDDMGTDGDVSSLKGPLVYAYSFSEFFLHALEQFLGRFVDLLCRSFCLLLDSICDILYGCCNRFINDINQ